MYYYIFNPKTKHRYTHGTASGCYNTERGAKAALTRLKKTIAYQDYTTISAEKFFAQDIDVIVISMMSGKEVVIRQSQKGNPAVDPSMEGYWSM